MKILVASALICLTGNLFSQTSENLIPKEAVSVFSLNNVDLFQQISLDELVKYEFMEELQQELFDGSTNGRTLKDSGLDFDQRLSFFQGKNKQFEVSGFTFGVTNTDQLFEVFDDYQPTESKYPGVDFYASYFNRIAIKGNTGILFRVQAHMNAVDEMTDSIWFARGNDYPWYNEDLEELNELFRNLEEKESSSSEIEFEGFEEMETEEHTNTPEENSTLPLADEDPTEKTYYELRDSVELILQMQSLDIFCENLFIKGENLVTADPSFADRLNTGTEGTFYFDNQRNLERGGTLGVLKSLYPQLSEDIEAFYEKNIILGDLVISSEAVELKLDVNYSEKLGSIYEELTDTKFDKNVLKYIHKDNSAYFTYNVDLRKAYEKMYEVVIPILSDADGQVSMSALTLELLDEFVNKDALFGVYQGSMFGTFNGIQKIKTKKIIFEYDEDTFEYTEREVEAEEDMPIFTLGFTTRRNDIPEKILKRVSKMKPQLKKKGTYWIAEDAVLGGAPLYLVLKNNLFIVTNDAELAEGNSNGYGKNALSKRKAKKARKSGVMYGFVDTGKAVESLPRGLFGDQENELIDVVRGKTGTMEITSTSTSSSQTSFNIAYHFEGDSDSSTNYILDLINSLYVISK